MTHLNTKIDEQLALLDAVKHMRRAQLTAMTFADESLLDDNERMKQYFDSDFDSEADKEMEKVVAAAAVKAVYASDAIPDSNKEAIARMQANAAVELMRYGKLDYHYATCRIYAREYDRRMRENSVAQRVVQVRRTRNMIVHAGIKLTISAAASAIVHSATASAATASVAGVATLASGVAAVAPIAAAVTTFAVLTFGYRLLPAKIRKPIEKKIDELQERACDFAVDAAKTLCRKLEPVAQRILPIAEKAHDMARKVGRSIQQSLQKTVSSLSRAGRKVMSAFGF